MPINDLIDGINKLEPYSFDDICKCFLTEDEDCFDFVRKSDVATIINNYILEELKRKQVQIKLDSASIQHIFRNQESVAHLRYPCGLW